jgi:hypothetical protein
MALSTSDCCGRRGCGKSVVNGMQCHECSRWFHESCTGLSEVQYTVLSNIDRDFRCMMCLTDTALSIHQPAPQVEVTQESPSPTVTANHLVDVETNTDPTPPDSITNSLLLLSDQMERHSRSVADLTDGVASLAQRLLAMEDVCNALPLSRAATEADKLSKRMIEAAAESKADAILRSKRVLVCGLLFSLDDPVDTAKALILPIFHLHPHIKVSSASWFFRKYPVSTRPLLISFGSSEQRTVVLQAKHIIASFHKGVQIYADRPVSLRSPLKSPLPSSARIAITPIDTAIVDYHISSALSSNYQSPLESPTLTPTKSHVSAANISSLNAIESKPTFSGGHPTSLSISNIAPTSTGLPFLPMVSNGLSTTTQTINTSTPNSNPTSAVPKNEIDLKIKKRPPARRNTNPRSYPSYRARATPLMSIVTRPLHTYPTSNLYYQQPILHKNSFNSENHPPFHYLPYINLGPSLPPLNPTLPFLPPHSARLQPLPLHTPPVFPMFPSFNTSR